MTHMPIKVNDKSIHAIAATTALLVCALAVIWKPSLIKDAPTALGTVGTFATAYGVIFAIIELRRAKAAAALARDESERVLRAVTSLVTAREIVECQATVSMAVSSIDEGRQIPSSTLCQIVKLYSQVFYVEVSDEGSPHRKNRSILESYSFNPNVHTKQAAPKNTKRALLSIASQLAELQGSTKNFTEYAK